MMPPLLLSCALVCYLLATVRYHRTMARGPLPPGDEPRATPLPEDELWSRGRAWMWPALALHSVALACWSVQAGHLPTRGLPETLCLMSWAMIVLYLGLARAWRMQALGTLAAPTASLLVLSTLLTYPWRGTPTTPDPGWMLSVHVGAVVVGYAAFLLASIVAMLYFIQAWFLKRKAFKRFLRQMPSLDNLDRVTYRLVALGFAPMLIGAMAGFVRAYLTTGIYPPFDTVMGVLICAIYATYMHARVVGGWHGRRVNGLLLLGFVLLVATYVGRVVVPWLLQRI